MNEVAQEFIAQSRHHLAEDFLPKIQRCVERLSDEQVWWRANPQSNSIGNLILHLNGNVRQWIVSGLGGAADTRDRDSEFAQTEIIPRAALIARITQTISDADLALSDLDHDALLEKRSIQGSEVTALEAILHVVEHFSMHTGQIILLTKIVVSADLSFYDFSGSSPVPQWSKQ